MKFKVFSKLSYDVITTTSFFFNILVTKSDTQKVLKESFTIHPPIPFKEYTSKVSSNRMIKLKVEKGASFTITYKAEVASNHSRINENDLLASNSIINLNSNILPFLNPSRHCESDKLMEFAIESFGFLPNEYSKVLAIEEWIFNNIKYTTGSTNSSVSAVDTFKSKIGVCKDFAHLGIAFCRALDIPARYLTAYATNLKPPDFHACFEAYINGHWLVFDATKLAELNGLVKISNSIDASEAAVLTYFGDVFCTFMEVDCKAVSEEFVPFDWGNRRGEAISY